MCIPVETRLLLRRQNDEVEGLVIRRTGCCTCRTPVALVTNVVMEENGSEALPSIYLRHAAGSQKVDIGKGVVEGLEAAVNPWLG